MVKLLKTFSLFPDLISVYMFIIVKFHTVVGFSFVNCSTRPKKNVFLKSFSLVPRVHSNHDLNFVPVHATVAWALILLSFRAFKENFREEN